ncbi:putative nuclease with TOPRIM domain [Brassicibacter mesophilus]
MSERLNSLETETKGMSERLNSLETETKGMVKRLDSLKIDVEGIKEEHGALLRGIEEKLQLQSNSIEKIEYIEGDIKAIKKDINKIKKDINIVEQVTAKNWSEISELKAVR